MAEVATLILKVDSRGAKSASADLDKLTAGAGKAERATGALTGAWKVLTTVAASAALAKAVGVYVRLADQSANMAARLRLATNSQEEFNVAHRETFQIAQRTSTELASVVDLYAKLSQSTGELGVSQGDLLRLTETITQTFQISGATAQEAAGGLRQLSQAMAGGVLRAEEFNSIIESSPRLVKALADGMGVEFGKVRQLVNEGKISSEELVNALLSQSQAIQSEFDQMPLTVGRALQEVRNALTGLVGGADEASGATSGLAGAIEDLAEALADPDFKETFNSLVTGATNAASAFVTLTGEIGKASAELQEWLQLQMGGNRAFGGENLAAQRRELQAINDELERRDNAGVFTGLRLSRIGMTPRRALEASRSRLQESIALNEMLFGDPSQRPRIHLIDPTDPASMSIAPPAPTAGGRPPSATQDIKDRTAARKELTQAEREYKQLMEEIAAHEEVVSDRQRELGFERIQRDQERRDAAERASKEVANLIAEMEFENSLIGKSVEEQERLIAARLAGAGATDEQREAIKRLLKEGREGREAEADLLLLRDGAKDLFRTIVTDSARASDALNRFFDTLKARAADKVFEGLLSGFAGMAGGGGWSGFLQGFGKGFKGARAAGGPVQAGGAYLVGENGPELFAPGQSGRVHPIGGGAGGTPVVNLTVHGAPSQPETKIKPNGSGGFDMEILFKAVEGRMVQSLAGGGALAAAGKARFGWREVI